MPWCTSRPRSFSNFMIFLSASYTIKPLSIIGLRYVHFLFPISREPKIKYRFFPGHGSSQKGMDLNFCTNYDTCWACSFTPQILWIHSTYPQNDGQAKFTRVEIHIQIIYVLAPYQYLSITRDEIKLLHSLFNYSDTVAWVTGREKVLLQEFPKVHSLWSRPV